MLAKVPLNWFEICWIQVSSYSSYLLYSLIIYEYFGIKKKKKNICVPNYFFLEIRTHNHRFFSSNQIIVINLTTNKILKDNLMKQIISQGFEPWSWRIFRLFRTKILEPFLFQIGWKTSKQFGWSNKEFPRDSN
jgi:hypothetical protein